MQWTSDSEDDAVLEAALQFVDTSDVFSTASSSSSSSSSTASPPLEYHARVSLNPKTPLQVQVQVQCTQTRATSPPRQVKRAKHQIEELQVELLELQATLAQLQQQHHHQAHTTDAVVTSAWESMALRQRRQRQRVEDENTRLRDMVHEQGRLVRQLQRLISDHQARATKLLSGVTVVPAPSLQCRSLGLAFDAAGILDAVSDALLPMYAQTPWLLANQQHESPSMFRVTTENLPGSSDALAVQLVDSRLLPFLMEKTTHAVWQNLLDRLGSRRSDCVVKEAAHSDALCMRRAEYLKVPGFDGFIQATMALRRFDEADRVIMVRSSVFTYLDPEGTCKRVVVSGLTIRHFLWTVVQKPSHGALRRTDPHTVMSQIQTFGMAVPASTSDIQTHTSAITAFLTDLSTQFCERAREDVENRLLSLPVFPCRQV